MHLSAGCSQASQQAGAKLTRSDSAPMNISAVPCTYFGRSYVRGVKVKWLRFTKYDRRHGNPVKLETTEAEADDAYEQRSSFPSSGVDETVRTLKWISPDL